MTRRSLYAHYDIVRLDPYSKVKKRTIRLAGMETGQIVVSKPLPALVADERLGGLACFQLGNLCLGLILVLVVILGRGLSSLNLLE